MIIRSKFLEHIIQQWKSNFTGTSALALADYFELTHNRVIATLEKLARNGKVNLRKTRLGRIVINHKNGVDEIKMRNLGMVDTVIAFPEKHILEDVFRKEGKDYGIFTNRLHKGDSQIKLYYFRQDVLDKYFRYQNRYNIHDDIVNGNISTKDTYYYSLHESIRDEALLHIRYGKRRLKNGDMAIAIIVHDLSDLSYSEQQYWASYELTDVEFIKGDREFEQFVRMHFGGEFGQYEDPIGNILDTIKHINSITLEIANGNLFRADIGQFSLQYIVVNTTDAYQNAHKELYKLLGSDSLNKNIIIHLLKKRFNVKDAELLENNGRERRPWGLFKLLVQKCDINFDPLQKCFDERVSNAHILGQRDLPNINLTIKFRKDCKEILETLKKIQAHLK